MNFFAIDFETANSSRLSACSIGLSQIKDGKLEKEEYFLIKPPEGIVFNPFNKKIHGISEEDVAHQPTFDQIWPKIAHYFEGTNGLAHNAVFDFRVLRELLEFYNIPLPKFHYGCTVLLSRKLWPDLDRHRLDSMAEFLGLSFEHHHAGEDARICAYIGLEGLKKTQSTTIEEAYQKARVPFQSFPNSLTRVEKNPRKGRPIKIKVTNLHVDPNHPFFKKNIVFTGTLRSMSRQKAMQAVANRNSTVYNAVGKGTDYLVLGKWKDGQRRKSTKLRKAEHLLSEGARIHIIDENRFLELLGVL